MRATDYGLRTTNQFSELHFHIGPGSLWQAAFQRRIVSILQSGLDCSPVKAITLPPRDINANRLSVRSHEHSQLHRTTRFRPQRDVGDRRPDGLMNAQRTSRRLRVAIVFDNAAGSPWPAGAAFRGPRVSLCPQALERELHSLSKGLALRVVYVKQIQRHQRPPQLFFSIRLADLPERPHRI